LNKGFKPLVGKFEMVNIRYKKRQPACLFLFVCGGKLVLFVDFLILNVLTYH
jgi:hypothetical protein